MHVLNLAEARNIFFHYPLAKANGNEAQKA
jgi:hypothetical protein